MSITTPDPAETPSVVKVKAAGEGAMRAENPFEKWLPEYLTVDEYDAAVPAAKTKAVSDAKGASKLIERAKSFVGTPYKWGGTGPLGFDCSGFTQYLYKELRISLPRISNQQGAYGARVSLDQAKPGDLIFWDTSSRNDGADHVAIYLGNGQVIHAPKPGDAVKISSVWGNPWAVSMNL